MTLEKKELGARGEEAAVLYLERCGYQILERNYHIRLGEIDVIAEHGGDLVFIEVKTRVDNRFGSPFDSVTASKQKQLSKVALEYVSRHDYHNRPCRFDVVGVRLKPSQDNRFSDSRIELIQNAFEFCYGIS